MYEKDVELMDWIESLPTIYYDFDTGEATCATHNIKPTLDEIASGNYCMGFGSDTILKTSYYNITNVLDYSQGHRFDEFIERMLPRLLDLEYTSITNQLNSVQTPGHRFDEFIERMLPRLLDLEYTSITNQLNSVQTPGLRLQTLQQPPLNPSTYQNNVHIE